MKPFRSLALFASLIWTYLKMMCNTLYGVWHVSRFKHAPVTVFGGARLKHESVYMKKASQLAQKLAYHGIPVLTGGGPGIMEAASCGALSTNRHYITTLGISVKGLEVERDPALCKRNVIMMDSFAARKWLLIHYSVGFAVFPGGFGTLNELTELLTLIQTKLTSKAPIVLIGKEYWEPLMVWIQESALKNKLIAQEDVELFTLTDDIEEAFLLLKRHVEKKQTSQFE